MLILSDCKIIIVDWLRRTAFISGALFSNSFIFIMTIYFFCAAYKQQTGKEKKLFAHKKTFDKYKPAAICQKVKYKILIYPDVLNECEFPDAVVQKQNYWS